MGIKDKLESHPVVVGAVAVILIAIAVYVLFRSQPEPTGGFGSNSSRFFWDTDKGELFIGPDVVPPVPRDPNASNGPAVGVWAHVFSCGDCKDANSRQVVYLRTWPDDVAAELKKLGRSGTLIFEAAPPETIEKALVKRQLDKSWVSITSDEGRAIVAQASEPCPDGKNRVECDP